MASGTIANREQELSAALAAAHEDVRRVVANAPVNHVDETGRIQAGKKRWLWVAAIRSMVYFPIHPRCWGSWMRETQPLPRAFLHAVARDALRLMNVRSGRERGVDEQSYGAGAAWGGAVAVVRSLQRRVLIRGTYPDRGANPARTETFGAEVLGRRDRGTSGQNQFIKATIGGNGYKFIPRLHPKISIMILLQCRITRDSRTLLHTVYHRTILGLNRDDR